MWSNYVTRVYNFIGITNNSTKVILSGNNIIIKTTKKNSNNVKTNKVWSNSVTPVSNILLSATDLDSPPQHVVFEFQHSKHGHFAMRENPHDEIVIFSQRDVDRGEIVFAHTGWLKINCWDFINVFFRLC